MNTPCPHVYEIEFDVLEQRREEYAAWLETDSLDWFAHSAIGGFEVYHNTQNLSPRIRLVFEFDSLQEWSDFVVSDEHRTTMDHLRHFTTGLDATLWRRSSLRLDGPADTPQQHERDENETAENTGSKISQSCHKN